MPTINAFIIVFSSLHTKPSYHFSSALIMNTTATVPTPNLTLMSYDTPYQCNPRKICFSTCKEDGKHFVRYAMVTGSKRVRHQLDMPCSKQVFDRTLEQIAEERYHKHFIRTEIGVLQAEGEVLENDIREALSTPDVSGVQFWENNEMLFGSHDDKTLVQGTTRQTPMSQSSYTHFSQAIANNDVLKEKHYFIRDTNEIGTFEHLFAIVYRFQLDTECVFVYASHVETTGKRVKLRRREEIWSMLNEEVRQHPKQWFGVPVDVTFKDLCEIDRWEA